MNWKEIKVNKDHTCFELNGINIFNRYFLEVLKFHEPGIAPVKDITGAYHIDIDGKDLYTQRYERTFGFYCNRAAVRNGADCFHIDEKGKRTYKQTFAWVGNYQENICTVRDSQNNYFHIDQFGSRFYSEVYFYCGDFKDGVACVKTRSGNYRHIDSSGNFINNKEFIDLGVFHKSFATAKDEKGWFHIDIAGEALYPQRYFMIEPYYNGFALVEDFQNSKKIIDEQGKVIHPIS
jgi:hypothetical protein